MANVFGNPVHDLTFRSKIRGMDTNFLLKDQGIS